MNESTLSSEYIEEIQGKPSVSAVQAAINSVGLASAAQQYGVSAFQLDMIVRKYGITIPSYSASASSSMQRSPTQQSIKISDFDMPFSSMVAFMVKWAIASIPAIIILFVIGMVAAGIFGGVIAGLMGR